MVVSNSLDKEIIIKYIEKCYSFDNNFQSQFLVIDNLTKNYHKKETFIKLVSKVFGNFTINNGYTVSDIIEEWFNDNVNRIVTEINNYLDNNLIVKLGSKEWDIYYKKEDKLFNYNHLTGEFKHKYNSYLIKSLYQDWYTKNILKESDRLLNLPWS